MDVAMLSHSISNILQCRNSLTPLPSRLSGIDINQLENILTQINYKVQKHSHFSEWLQKVKDVVIDLNDLMEDLRHKESITDSSKSIIKTGLNIINRYQFKKAIVQVNKATEELELLLKEEKAVISNTNEKRKSAYKDFEKSTEHVTVGREREKKEIIAKLLKMNNADAVVPAVIAIVGVPGIGKTKLARLVCEDEQVKANSGFQPIWINLM
jgi:transcriptional regulator with AAA-type ATPase domain